MAKSTKQELKYARDYYEKNKAKVLARQAEYRVKKKNGIPPEGNRKKQYKEVAPSATPEKQREYKKRHYDKNRDKVLKRKKELKETKAMKKAKEAQRKKDWGLKKKEEKKRRLWADYKKHYGHE